MSPEQHARAKEIFLAACERPADKRSEFLDQACGDDHKLRAHLDGLLRHHTAAESTRCAGEGEPPAGAGHPPKRSLEPGTMIADRYRIVSLLGKGGMGEVYRADDLMLVQPVALKFLRPHVSRNPRWLGALVREARMAREITHPNVCRVHDIHVDEVAGEAFISMEYIDGEDLGSLLRRIGRFPRDKAFEVARNLCVGLAAAHAKGILHRDLKPANIMIDGEGRVRITDFGLAATREQIATDEIRSGTPGYMAPELFAGTDVSVQSDIYALGLVLYELFTGQPAFQADSFTEFARLHQRTLPTPPRELIADLPAEVDYLIQNCLEKAPSDRPSSALAVAAALPGSDPLALSLAAGVTPTPAFVAASGAKAGLRSTTAIGLLASFFVSLLLVVLLADRSGLTLDLEDTKPANVLAEQARRLTLNLGCDAALDHEAFGFSFRLADDFLGCGRGQSAHDLAFATSKSGAIGFWYRRGPNPMTPATPLNVTFGRARATLRDPPRTTPGMVALVLGSSGQLLGFEALPPYLTEQDASQADWTPLFAAAGLVPGDFVVDSPKLHPWIHVDEQYAWVPRGSTESTAAIRIEAAAFRGQPVLFAVLREPATSSSASRCLGTARRRGFANNARVALLAVAVMGAIPLAWLSLRRGRGDRQGAFRVSAAVFAGRLVVWTLGASHARELEAELLLLLFAILRAWFEASLVWLFYIALEPHVRRFWPQTVVAWSRLLAGRLRDPVVARDVLVGTLLGVLIALLFELERFFLSGIGWETRDPLRLAYNLEPLLGARHGVSACANTLLAAVYLGLFLVTLLVITRVLLRRTWLAGIVTILAAASMYLPSVAHPGISWLPLGVVLACVVWAAIRYGLVVVVCAILVNRLLLQLPLNFVPGEMGWDMALFVLLVVSSMAVYGFFHARRPAPASIA